MLQDYTELRKAFWGQHLWGRGYFAEREAGSDGKIVNYFNEDDYKHLNNTFITNLS